MSGVITFVLCLQGLVFAAWGIQAFRCLFKLRADAVADAGHMWPGLTATLRAFRGFVTLPKYARDRRILLLLTVLLFVLIGVVVALAPAGAAR